MGLSSHDKAAWRRAPLAMALATVAGIGHLPGGPGSYAAAVALPAIAWASHLPLGWRALAWALATAASVWASHQAGLALGEEDSRKIVIDEVVGVWAALLWWPELGWLTIIVGYVAFRVLDVVKPWPIRPLEHRVGGGLGVTLDDVIAGVMSWPVVALAALV